MQVLNKKLSNKSVNEDKIHYIIHVESRMASQERILSCDKVCSVLILLAIFAIFWPFTQKPPPILSKSHFLDLEYQNCDKKHWVGGDLFLNLGPAERQ